MKMGLQYTISRINSEIRSGIYDSVRDSYRPEVVFPLCLKVHYIPQNIALYLNMH